MRFLKKKLRENLSLSSKLFLRQCAATTAAALRNIANAPQAAVQRLGDIAEGRGLPAPRWAKSIRYDIQPPPAASIDLKTPVADLSTQEPIRNKARSIQSSIVIPVFNKAAFTFQCLRSLLREIDLGETEIIVVDNASSDQTAEVLLYFNDFIHVITNEENRGFVDACNQGAAAAQGEFLVFLNNDTEVSPGWLKHLEQTAQQNTDVGAVGSMFLYPDGTIQEAGAIVWKNGEAHHYGWSASPDDRRFNFARQVDYCSAASLLIRKSIFDRLGGFDRRFAPAYYEDIDLCFGVRSLGYKVIYQPASRLIHYEGATAGRDVKKGVKQFQIINRERFVEKWRRELEHKHFEKDLQNVPAAARRLLGPTVLVFDERVPTPDRDAGSARMSMILKALAQWSHVIFMAFNRAPEPRYEATLWQAGIQTADMIDYRRLLKSQNVTAAIVSRPLLAKAMIPRIRRADLDVTVVFDMVDAYFIRLQREASLSQNAEMAESARKYHELEVHLAQLSDLIWCNSSEDKRVMQSEAPEKRIEVIPTIHELYDRGKSFEARSDLLFVGNFAHRPNLDGIHFFMDEIFALLQQTLPQIGVNIVGDNPAPEILAYASNKVHVTGHIADIEPLFASARVFIAPIRFGAGVKGKVGESMAHGLPVVTTSIGAEGFGLTNERDILIADNPREFANCVTRLYSDKELWEKVAANAYRHVQQNFTPEVIAKVINGSIREVADARRIQS